MCEGVYILFNFNNNFSVIQSSFEDAESWNYPRKTLERRMKVLMADLRASVYCVCNCTVGQQKESVELGTVCREFVWCALDRNPFAFKKKKLINPYRTNVENRVSS